MEIIFSANVFPLVVILNATNNLSMNRNQLEINFFANEFLLHTEWKGENITLKNVEWFLPQTQTEIE